MGYNSNRSVLQNVNLFAPRNIDGKKLDLYRKRSFSVNLFCNLFNKFFRYFLIIPCFTNIYSLITGDNKIDRFFKLSSNEEIKSGFIQSITKSNMLDVYDYENIVKNLEEDFKSLIKMKFSNREAIDMLKESFENHMKIYPTSYYEELSAGLSKIAPDLDVSQGYNIINQIYYQDEMNMHTSLLVSQAKILKQEKNPDAEFFKEIVKEFFEDYNKNKFGNKFMIAWNEGFTTTNKLMADTAFNYIKDKIDLDILIIMDKNRPVYDTEFSEYFYQNVEVEIANRKAATTTSASQSASEIRSVTEMGNLKKSELGECLCKKSRLSVQEEIGEDQLDRAKDAYSNKTAESDACTKTPIIPKQDSSNVPRK